MAFDQFGLLLFVITATFMVCVWSHDGLRDKFHHFQIMTPKHLRVRTTRSSGELKRQKSMSFTILGQKVILKLKSRSLDKIFTPGGRIRAHSGNGSASIVHLDPEDFHEGIIHGHPGSRVHCVKYDNVWIIHATHPHDKNLSFSIEPLSLHTTTSNTLKMVAFRHQDIKLDDESSASSSRNHVPDSTKRSNSDIKCGGNNSSTESVLSLHQDRVGNQLRLTLINYILNVLNQINNKSNSGKTDVVDKGEIHTSGFESKRSINIQKEQGKPKLVGGVLPKEHHFKRRKTMGNKKRLILEDEEMARMTKTGSNRRIGGRRHSRKRRSSEKGDICDILSIIDYTFFSNVGKKSSANTAKYIFVTFAVVNDVFRKTDFLFNGKIQNVGVQIRGMEIMTDKKLDNGFPRYVLFGNNADDILKQMGLMAYFNQYCLIHLSTARVLLEKTLGVAVIAAADGEKRSQGICGGYHGVRNNVGLSTVSKESGKLSDIRTYTLIIAHELGHNFGGTHDDPTKHPTCAPSESEGGKYLMWWQTTKGTLPNNDKFSPCSRKQIGRILAERSSCLMTKEMIEASHCGNGRLDFGEDCDAGHPYYASETESCCNKNCRFIEGAVCSPYNHPCCKNCT